MLRFGPWILGFVIAGVLIGSWGCARVQPWEREQLAKDIMSFEVDERERALQRVIDKSQYEGVIGAGTTEGSGCGCN
jgi:hypothetical protein